MLPDDTPVPEAPARFAVAAREVLRSTEARPGRPAGDRGEIGGPGDPDQGQGLAEIRLRRGEVLVRDVDLFFQGVQLGIVIDLPPFAPGQLIPGLGHLPAGILFVSLGRGGGRPHVIRTHRTAGQQQQNRGRRGRGERTRPGVCLKKSHGAQQHGFRPLNKPKTAGYLM